MDTFRGFNMNLFYLIVGILLMVVAYLVYKGRTKNAVEKLPDEDETYDTNKVVLFTSATLAAIGVVFLLTSFHLIRTFDMIIFTVAILIIGIVSLMIFGRNDA